MTVEELRIKAIKMFGRRWKAKLAKELQINYSTIYRWNKQPNETKVHHYLDVFFDVMEEKKRLQRITTFATQQLTKGK